MKNGESGVRYGAALGLRMRGAAAVEPARTGLRTALAEESPSVRIAAASALGLYGNAEDLELVLPVLKELVSPEINGIYVSIEALNVVDALGPKAAPLREFIKTIPAKDLAVVGRAGECWLQLLRSILNQSPTIP